MMQLRLFTLLVLQANSIALRLVSNNAKYAVCGVQSEYLPTFDRTPYELPNTVIPTAYHILISFFGGTGNKQDEVSHVYMNFRTRTELTSITFYAAELEEVKAKEVRCLGGIRRKIMGLKPNKGRETLTAMLDGPIKEGSVCRMHVSYRPIVHPMKVRSGLDNVGFYSNTEKGYLLLTQGEDFFTRRMFPGFHEPGRKAVLHVTLRTTLELNKRVTVVSNMPQKKQVQYDDFIYIVFKPTPVMSTYLFALGVVETDKMHFVKNNEGQILGFGTNSTYIMSDIKHAVDLTAQTYDKLFSYLEDGSGEKIPKPMPYLKVGIVPNFGGGMENWGLIYESLRDSTVIHETCHSIFGNLMTMKNWDNWWFNEGINSFFTNRMREKILGSEPSDYDMWNSNWFSAMSSGAHLKGQGLFNTEKLFIAGIRRLAINTAFKAGGVEEFADAMGTVAERANFTGTWSGNPKELRGYVKHLLVDPQHGLLFDVNETATHITVELKCEAPERLYSPKGCRKGKAYVPIFYTTTSPRNISVAWITPSTTKVEIPKPTNGDRVYLNPECRGHYLLRIPTSLKSACMDSSCFELTDEILTRIFSKQNEAPNATNVIAQI